jgi:hypothetical protein
MSTRLKKEVYGSLDDRYLKMLLGQGWKVFKSDEEFAETLQRLLHVTPMTRRFDEKTVSALQNNQKNDSFKTALRLAIAEGKAGRNRKTLH